MVIEMRPLGGVLLALMIVTSTACQKTGGDEAVQPQIESMRNSPKLSRRNPRSCRASGPLPSLAIRSIDGLILMMPSQAWRERLRPNCPHKYTRDLRD